MLVGGTIEKRLQSVNEMAFSLSHQMISRNISFEGLENILWNLTAIRYDFKKALSQMYFCYRSPMGGLKLACWPRYWLCACSISLMEQTLLWRLWPSHMMSLVKTDGQMEAVSTSLNAFLLLKKRHFGFRVSRCWIQN